MKATFKKMILTVMVMASALIVFGASQAFLTGFREGLADEQPDPMAVCSDVDHRLNRRLQDLCFQVAMDMVNEGKL